MDMQYGVASAASVDQRRAGMALTVTLKRYPDRARFLEIAQSVGLIGMFDGSDPNNYTVMVPPDAAIDQFLADQRSAGGEISKEALRRFVLNHVVKGIVWHMTYDGLLRRSAMSAPAPYEIDNVNGQKLKIFYRGRTVFVACDGSFWSAITKPDSSASNGVAHLVAGVVCVPRKPSA